MASEKQREAEPITQAEIDVLDFGSGNGQVCRSLFPKARICRLDVEEVHAPDVIADITDPLPVNLHLRFDIVWASHVLEHVERGQVVGVVRNIRKALRYGGLAYLVVPALEWAANEIRKDKPSDGLLAFLYGEPGLPHQAHLSGYTLMMLRQLATMGGLHVREAYQTQFVMTLTGKDFHEEYLPTQNIVVAMRAQDDEVKNANAS
jgi:SAM-dependent methyltransferase